MSFNKSCVHELHGLHYISVFDKLYKKKARKKKLFKAALSALNQWK